MPNESTHWPVLGEVVEADPYPFHGLVWRVIHPTSGPQYLRPHDGRPDVLYNAPPNNVSTLIPYIPVSDGILWDIGRPDPPVTPLIHASGGTSWGRRILSASPGATRLPARVGGRTVLIDILQTNPSGLSQPAKDVYLQFDGQNKYIGRITLSDFGAALDSIYQEGTDTPINAWSGRTWSLAGAFLDASPDGCRRLYGAYLGASPASVSFPGDTLVGVFEIVITSAGGEPAATLSVLRQASSCLGVYSRSGHNTNRKRWTPDHYSGSETGDPCGTRYVLSDWLPGTEAVSGSTGFTVSRTGMVIGAQYINGQVDYMTCDTMENRERTSSWSREPWVGTRTQAGGCLRGPETAAIHSFSGVHTRQITLHVGGHSQTYTRVVTEEATVISTSTDTQSTGSTIITVGDLSRSTFPPAGIDWLSPVVTEPAPHALMTLPNSDTWRSSTFGVTYTRRWAAVCGVWGSNWAAGPMIHPGGTLGDWKIATYAQAANAFTPPYAYCPITGSAVRGLDFPNPGTIVAYI